MIPISQPFFDLNLSLCFSVEKSLVELVSKKMYDGVILLICNVYVILNIGYIAWEVLRV